jgi:hypothetical protein
MCKHAFIPTVYGPNVCLCANCGDYFGIEKNEGKLTLFRWLPPFRQTPSDPR